MMKKCEDCSYYTKFHDQAWCDYYPEIPTKINDDGLPCSIYTGDIDEIFDDPYENESYTAWFTRMKNNGGSGAKRSYIKPLEEKPIQKSRFDDII